MGNNIQLSAHLYKGKEWMQFHLDHKNQSLKNRNRKGDASKDKFINIKNAPEKPKVTLLMLYRRHIYLRPKLDESKHLKSIEFMVLDSDDNITNQKLIEITRRINDFMEYHQMAYHYSITFYV